MELGDITIAQLVPAVSVVIAAIIATLQLRANERQTRATHTLSILGELSSNRIFADTHYLIQEIYAKGDEAPEPTAEQIRAIINLVSHYEHIATAYFAKNVDRATVLRQRGGSFQVTYIVAEEWIKERRRELNAPGLYIQFERVATNEVRKHVKRYGQRHI